MNKYCGGIYEISYIDKKNNYELQNILNYVWHSDWLTILNYIKEFKDKDFKV